VLVVSELNINNQYKVSSWDRIRARITA